MKKYVAEFFGTLVLTLLGCGAFAMTEETGSLPGVLGIALAFGLVLMAMSYTIGDVSGCHLNPAVSLGMFIDGRMSLGDFIFYLLAQFLGGFAGAGILFIIMICSDSLDTEILGANGYGDLSAAGINIGGALAVEFILTLLFVLTVLAVTARYEYIRQSGFIVGITYMAVHIFGVPLTGTGINPARSLAPAVFTGVDAIIQVWVFIVAPLLGAVAAAFLYRFLIKESDGEGAYYEEGMEEIEEIEEEAGAEDTEEEEELEEEVQELVEEELEEIEDEEENEN